MWDIVQGEQALGVEEWGHTHPGPTALGDDSLHLSIKVYSQFLDSFCACQELENLFLGVCLSEHWLGRADWILCHRRSVYYLCPFLKTLKWILWDYGSLEEETELLRPIVQGH